MKRKLPEHGWCFVCGSENPHSIGLSWWVDEDGILTSEFSLNEAQQGPPGIAHGGASAAILDEAMGLVVWAAGLRVAAVNIEINYQHPLPLGRPLRLEAHITEREERKVFSAGEIRLEDGSVAVSGHGIYVVAPQLFEQVELKTPPAPPQSHRPDQDHPDGEG
jgi:acyl-coenzyme A thioesterase PaaI-like protein